MAGLFWLSDEAWAAIEPYLPKNQSGARRVDDRCVISGTFHVLKSGCRWATARPPIVRRQQSRATTTTRLRRSLRQAGAVPVIPGRSNCKRTVHYDCNCYKGRHLIESAFCRLKDFRRVATRYDKLAANFFVRRSPRNSARCFGYD